MASFVVHRERQKVRVATEQHGTLTSREQLLYRTTTGLALGVAVDPANRAIRYSTSFHDVADRAGSGVRESGLAVLLPHPAERLEPGRTRVAGVKRFE